MRDSVATLDYLTTAGMSAHLDTVLRLLMCSQEYVHLFVTLQSLLELHAPATLTPDQPEGFRRAERS